MPLPWHGQCLALVTFERLATVCYMSLIESLILFLLYNEGVFVKKIQDLALAVCWRPERRDHGWSNQVYSVDG